MLITCTERGLFPLPLSFHTHPSLPPVLSLGSGLFENASDLLVPSSVRGGTLLDTERKGTLVELTLV